MFQTRHKFNRGTIYEDVMGTYNDDLEEVLSEYPLRVQFKGEQAVDSGGVVEWWSLQRYVVMFLGESVSQAF